MWKFLYKITVNIFTSFVQSLLISLNVSMCSIFHYFDLKLGSKQSEISGTKRRGTPVGSIFPIFFRIVKKSGRV